MAAMQPAYGKEGILIPSLKAILEVGTYVVYCDTSRAVGDNERIARIIDYNYDEQGKRKMSLHIYNETGGNFVPIGNVYAIDIHDLAFAVSNSESHQNFGRTNIVCINSNCTDGVAFPCNSPQCPIAVSFSRSIWNDIERVRAMFRKMLTSSSMQQGQFTRKREYLPLSMNRPSAT
jgi:hypothetical protein